MLETLEQHRIPTHWNMEQVEETVVPGDDGFQFFQLAFIALFENGLFFFLGQRNPNGDKAFQDRTK